MLNPMSARHRRQCAKQRWRNPLMEQFYLAMNDTQEDRERKLANIFRFAAGLALGKTWTIDIEEYKKPRSNPQNSYLWGVVYQTVEDATGQEAEDWHVYFLGEHFGWKEVTLFGRRRMRPRRTTTKNEAGKDEKLTTTAFCAYCAFIQRHCAEKGIYVPDPNEEIRAELDRLLEKERQKEHARA